MLRKFGRKCKIKKVKRNKIGKKIKYIFKIYKFLYMLLQNHFTYSFCKTRENSIFWNKGKIVILITKL